MDEPREPNQMRRRPQEAGNRLAVKDPERHVGVGPTRLEQAHRLIVRSGPGRSPTQFVDQTFGGELLDSNSANRRVNLGLENVVGAMGLLDLRVHSGPALQLKPRRRTSDARNSVTASNNKSAATIVPTSPQSQPVITRLRVASTA